MNDIKSILFKPFNTYLTRDANGDWQNTDCDYLLRFSSEVIDKNPNLFEIETYRKFNDGKLYWAKLHSWSKFEPVRYNANLLEGFYFIGTDKLFDAREIFEIGGELLDPRYLFSV